MTANLVAGIDVASEAVRVLICAEDGTLVATSQRRLPPIDRPRPGWSEQDAASWWPAVASALRGATRSAASRGVVAAVCVSATSGTVAAVGSDGTPLGPALMYDDRRAVRETAVAQRAGRDRWRRMGLTVGSSFSLPRIGWLAGRHAGQDWRLVHVADLIGWRLAGHPVPLDWSHALKSGYDVLAGEWAHEAMDALAVPAGVLPRVAKPTAPAGTVCREASELTGLPVGCSIRLGMTDGCAGQLAAGAERPGQFVTVLGTTLVVKGVTAGLVRDPQGSVYSHRHPDGAWLPGGASNTGGNALTRWRTHSLAGLDRGGPGGSADRGGGPGRLAELDHAAAARGPSSVISWPLRRPGERFPVVCPAATGFIEGTPADDADAYRADLEGVAYLERLCYERLEILGAGRCQPVIAVGGGARSSVWSSIRATVLGDGLAVASEASTAAGACLLGAAGTIHRDLTAATQAMVKPARFVEPDATTREAMAHGYARWTDALRRRGWLT